MKAVVLLSGGLDSVVNFKCALDECSVLVAVTFDYGQIAFEGEARAARECAARYRTPHRIVELGWFREIVDNPITGKGSLSRPEDEGAAEKHSLLEETWVPNRNAVFVNIGAAFAESLGAEMVVAGLNAEEAEEYPDNSARFLDLTNAALAVSTLSGVKVKSYTLELDKRETVALGLERGAPLDLIYSCYERPSGGRMCGVCPSCARLKAALEANGVAGRYENRFAK